MSDTIRTSRLEGSKLVVDTKFGSKAYDSKFLVAALLIYIARGNGGIGPEESAKMIELIEHYFHLQPAESLELLTRAMSDLADDPELGEELTKLAPTLSDEDRENIALMALKVIAADGRRDVDEMERFNQAVNRMGISPDIVHRAFDRYFSETMPGK